MPQTVFSSVQPSLRWLALALLVLASPFFFVGGPAWTDGLLHKSAWNLGHIGFFGLLTFAIQPWRYLIGWRLWLFSTLAVLALGIAIEWAQSLNGRQMGADDILRNLIGLWAVLAIIRKAAIPGARLALIVGIRFVAFALLFSELGTVGHVALKQWQVSQLPPRLFNFEHPDPDYFWDGNLAADSADICGPDGENALLLQLSTRLYSGGSLHNLPDDWSHYQTLDLSFWNPGDQPLTITLRINDWEHEKRSGSYSDRFNRRFMLKPGLNRISQSLSDIENAPADRAMDMTDIRRLLVFTTRLPAPRRLCLLDLRLSDPR